MDFTGPCPFLLCLVTAPHGHPECPACGAVRYGDFGCATCRRLRGNDTNPVTIHSAPPREPS